MLFHTLTVSLAFLRKNWGRCKIFILQRPRASPAAHWSTLRFANPHPRRGDS